MRFAHSTRTISAEGCAGKGQSHSRLHFAPSTRAISAEGCAHTGHTVLSPAFRALDTHDLRRGLRADRTNRTLACISRTQHARSPQRVAPGRNKSHFRLHFARSTRTISADGCAHACISRTRHARSPQKVARVQEKSHPRRLSPAFRVISAEGCAHMGQIALSPAFRALDTHDLRRGLPASRTNRILACISRTRHARSPQRVARVQDKSHSRLRVTHSTRAISAEGCAHMGQIALSPALHCAHSTRVISAEGCPRPGQIAFSPAFSALDTHDLRRGSWTARSAIG